MTLRGLTVFLSLTATVALALPAGAAMYKWVDEHGTTHYGDSVPPRYANRAADRNGKPVVQPASVEPKPQATASNEPQSEQQRAEGKRERDRQRQDTALLATYASEAEIEQARAREIARTQSMLKTNSVGLARSDKAEDRNKLDALMERSRRETDSINARFDAQLARYRSLTGKAPSAPAATAVGTTATVQ
jgi:hypothetical protein